MLVRDSVAAFLIARSHLKPATLAHYRGRLAAVVRAFGDRDTPSLVELEIRQHLDRESRFADGRPKAPDTIRANFIALDQWQQFAKKAGHIPALLITEYEKPGSRGRDRLPTATETETILQLAPPAFAVFYRALRLCGARPGELVRTTIADVDWQERVIELADHKTARKTKRPRRIAVGTDFGDLLRAAIGSRTEGPVFLSAKRKAWTVPGLGQVFRRIRTKANLPKDLVMYLARHEFASRLVDADVDIHAVATSLGHSGLQTVQRYVKVKNSKLVEWQNKVGEDHPPATPVEPTDEAQEKSA